MKFVRQLGQIENQMALFHRRHNGTTQIVQLISLSGNVDRNNMKNTAEYLYNHHQILRCCLVENKDGFSLYESLTIDDFYQLCTVTDLTDAVNVYVDKSLNLPLPQDNHLWQVELLVRSDEYHLLLKFHHSIIDSKGIFSLAKTILSFLDGHPPERKAKETVVDPIDKHLKDGKLQQQTNGSSLKCMEYELNSRLDERSTIYKTLSWDFKLTTLLKQYSQANNIQENSLYSALLLKGFYDTIPVDDYIEFKAAFSLREEVLGPEVSNGLACYIGVSSLAVKVKDLSVLEIARSYQSSLYLDVIRNVIRKKKVPFEILDKHISGLTQQSKFLDGIGITNLGKIPDLVAFENFNVIDYLTINSRNAGNVAIVMNVHEWNNALSMNLVTVTPLMSKETLQTISQSITAIVNDIVKEQNKLEIKEEKESVAL